MFSGRIARITKPTRFILHVLLVLNTFTLIYFSRLTKQNISVQLLHSSTSILKCVKTVDPSTLLGSSLKCHSR